MWRKNGRTRMVSVLDSELFRGSMNRAEGGVNMLGSIWTIALLASHV